jgi:hypothetical protein
MANVLKMMMVEAILSLRSAELSCREIARRWDPTGRRSLGASVCAESRF